MNRFILFFALNLMLIGSSCFYASDIDDVFVIDSKERLHDQKLFKAQTLIVDMPVPYDTIKHLKNCKSLRKLTLTQNFSFSSPGVGEALRINFFRAIRKLPLLEYIDVSGHDFSSKYLQFIPKSVKCINLDETSILSNALPDIPTFLEVVSLRNTFLGKALMSLPSSPYHPAKFILE